jgi:hypothetical protein
MQMTLQQLTVMQHAVLSGTAAAARGMFKFYQQQVHAKVRLHYIA